jgi:hypothetical protein
MKSRLAAIAFGAALLMLFTVFAVLTGGCVHTVKVEPIKVEPIYVTMDVYLKIDRELDNFFSFERTEGQSTGEKTENRAVPEGK